MTTYKKLTWDSYKIQVESAVRDGNGATISTTYATKTELTTGLGTKLDTTTAASTYATQTALSNGLAAKADKATTLGGYGITDGVTTNTAQTITATKSFIPASGSGTVVAGINAGDSSTARTNGTFVIKTNAGDRAYFNNYEDASNIITQLTALGHTAQNLEIISNKTSNEGFSKTPYRTYNAANVNDIVTIGSLAANPNVVHTTGNESISGYKTFVNDVVISEAYNPYFVTQTNNIPSRSALSSSATYYARWEWRAANGDVLGAIQFVHNANSNSTEVQVCSITNGTDYWRIIQ